MNDIDIIKAAECCFIKKSCSGCPLNRGDHVHSCIKDLQQTIPDFMNRLKTERDDLYKENLELKDGYFQKRYEESEHEELMGLREAWRKESMRNVNLQAEIERLNSCVKSEDEIRAIMKDQMSPMVKEIVNEQIDSAIKLSRIDFAERLKERMHDRFLWRNDIDNLLKEMESESNAK